VWAAVLSFLSKHATSLALNISEAALLLFGLLLVIGLVGEYSEKDRWKKHVRVFKWLVILGVGGELIADGGIFLLSGRLQSLADGEIAIFQSAVAQETTRAESFRSDIANANLRAAEAEQETARLNKLAADETIARQKIEAKIADRRLLAAQTKILKDCLREHPGTVVVTAIANDREAYTYAQDWREMFDAGGWKTGREQATPIQVFLIGGGMWSGVRITVHGNWDQQQNRAFFTPNSTEQFFVACMQKTQGIAASLTPDKDVPTGEVRVQVSTRPSPTP
jgi:hypothetical protein